jgi:2-phospho-L-lactate guanylyltransferase
MGLFALVPAKRFEAAKSRLGGVLDGAERAAFARRMFEHVVSTLGASNAFERLAVVTDSDEVARLAEGLGALALSDPASARTLADRVDASLAELERHGATAALVVMGDLPTLTVDDVGRLVRGLQVADVVVAPDGRGHHTNALGLRVPAPFRTHFGDAESLARHRETATAASLTVNVVETPGLAFDVDTEADYATLGRLNR